VKTKSEIKELSKSDMCIQFLYCIISY